MAGRQKMPGMGAMLGVSEKGPMPKGKGPVPSSPPEEEVIDPDLEEAFPEKDPAELAALQRAIRAIAGSG